MQKPFFSFILAITLLLPSIGHTSLKTVATVAAVRNTATATSLVTGKTRRLQTKSSIYEGDTIKTGKRGRIQIIFTDNTIISLGRSGNLSIHEYLWKPKQKEGLLKTEVKEGIFRVMGGAITKTNPEKFTTKTPAATIGIRGSMYAGRVVDNTLSVVFQGGLGIFVQNEHGRVEIPTPGHGTNVRRSQPPPPAIKFTPKEINSLTPSEEPPSDDTPTTTEKKEGEKEEDGNNQTPRTANSAQRDIAPDLPPANERKKDPPPIKPVPETTFPSTGITHYHGTLKGSVTNNNGPVEPIDETMEIFANWHNKTIIGHSYDPNFPGMPVMFWGKMSGKDVPQITFLAGSSAGMVVDVVEGTGSGYFEGATLDTLKLTANGSDYAVEPFTQPALATWTVGGESKKEITKPSATGTHIWKGYVVGLSENMNDINSNRHLVKNTDHDDFTLTVNKDTGVVAGTIKATGDSFSTNLNVGGTSTNSACVYDHLLGATLTGTVTNTSGTASLKAHGNYMFSGPMDQQVAEYATWGYWETAYQNPNSSEQYHNHVPGALWIAGTPTSSTDLNTLASGNVTGSYAGEVHGSEVHENGMVKELFGSFQMNVNFAELGQANAFTGSMQLDTTNFEIVSNSGPSTGQFQGNLIDTSGVTSGDISGTLFGPAAKSIGGNFSAIHDSTMNGTTKYQGIYGGNR